MSAAARAVALVDLGRYAQALEVLASAPPDAQTYLLRAQCLLALARPADAEEQLREGLLLEPDSEWGLRLLAYALLAQRRTADAARAAESAVAADPHEYLAYIALADCRREQALTGLALEAASAAVRLAPDRPEPHVVLSRVLRAAGRPDHAEAAARTALRLAPQDEDAAAALAEVLKSMLRLGEAQDVRLTMVEQNPGSDANVGELADVVQLGLLASMGFSLLVTVALLRDPLIESLDVLVASITVWVVTGALFMLLRWVVQRPLTAMQRRGLAPYRRVQERLYIASLALLLLVVAGDAAWHASRDDGRWALAAAVLGGAFAAYWIGTHGRDRRGGWVAVGRLLARATRRPPPGRLRENRSAAQRSRQLLRPVLPASEDAEQVSPATTYQRNARYFGHATMLVWLTFMLLYWMPAALPAVLVLAAVDAAVVDNVWPRLARRSHVLWGMDGHHVRVVGEHTGRPPGMLRSAIRGVVRLLMVPYLLPLCLRNRARVWVTPHDRLTRTRVVQVLSQTEAERHPAQV